MREKHPFGVFVPKNVKYLILGSFPGKLVDGNDWFYSTKRGQFWPILSIIYKRELKTVEQKKKLFTDLKLAVTDIILEAERTKNSNLDSNLKNLIYNTEKVREIVKKNKIQKIFFSSKFVEKIFKSKFVDIVKNNPEIKLITLPSSSPRYVQMTFGEKLKKYKSLLPEIKST